MNRIIRFAVLAVLPVLGIRLADAQVLYGSIVGTVTDPSGSVVQGAPVSATHIPTGKIRRTVTDEEGRYALSDLAAGEYEVQISASGFRLMSVTGVQVTINTVTRVDASLEIGAVAEVVSVSAEATRLQTDQGALMYELGGRAVADLPLPRYRNYQSLIDLVPGATPSTFQNAITDTPARALGTNLNGVNRNNNRTKIDGAANVYIWLPHHTAYVPPAETIETVNISTGAFDAEQGMAGGAAISVSTKSGSNDLHGSAFLFHDNSRFAAKNFFFLDARKPKSLVNIDGGTLGGPIVSNRLFTSRDGKARASVSAGTGCTPCRTPTSARETSAPTAPPFTIPPLETPTAPAGGLLPRTGFHWPGRAPSRASCRN